MKSVKLGISACLLGEKVRYDGGHKQDPFLVETFGRHVESRPSAPRRHAVSGCRESPSVWKGQAGA